jgi:hypothetical protein
MFETPITIEEIAQTGRKLNARIDAAFASVGIDVTTKAAPRQISADAKLKLEVATIEAANAKRAADKRRAAEIRRHLPAAEKDHAHMERGPEKDRAGRIILQAKAQLSRIEAGR